MDTAAVLSFEGRASEFTPDVFADLHFEVKLIPFIASSRFSRK